MTASEYYTWQFYTWEYRGRGLHEEDFPVSLEPPFMPFIRHLPQKTYKDEGKRHTWLSRLAEGFSGSKPAMREEMEALDYESIEAFPAISGMHKVLFSFHLGKERKVAAETMHILLTLLSSSVDTISFELIGNSSNIMVQLVSGVEDAAMIEPMLHIYLPGITIHKDISGTAPILRYHTVTSVISFALAEEFVRPIAMHHGKHMDSLTGFIGILENITGEEQVGMQVLFQGCVNKWNESIIHSVTDYDGKSFFTDAPEAPKLAAEKTNSPLFGVSVRLFVQADEQKMREQLLLSGMQVLQQVTRSGYNYLVPFAEQDMQQAVDDICDRVSRRTGMLLSAAELANLVHIPSPEIRSRKLESSTRKTKAVPAIAKNREYIIGINEHNHIQTAVTIGTEERLKHTHIIGATGTGKSTLIAHLALQDIAMGNGITLLDPHGDLVDDIIARLPHERVKDVLLIDPSDADFPVGLNIIEAHSDIEKEILSSDLVASFKKFATSWGDQMSTVLGNAIIAILESRQGGTLHDLRRFLIEDEYRREFVNTVTDPSIRYYWLKEYPLQRGNAVGSILTRLDTFLRPRIIRNMVVQKKGLNFEQLLNTNKIILVKLPQGLIGKENSYLLGSLIVSKLHQAAFARQGIQDRKPYFIYIDEFQNFITPSIKEMLSGVRKYNVGLILSHQDLQQLQREDSELMNSVLGNIYTRIVFRVGEPDARKLQDGFSGFDLNDLQNLGKGEAVVRIEQPQYDTSITTIAPKPVDENVRMQSQQAVAAHSRSVYAKPKEEVESILFESLDFSIKERKPGKKKEQGIEDDKQNDDIVIKQEKKVQNTDSEVTDKKIEPYPVKEIATPIADKGIEPITETSKERDTTHRYLQSLIKKMAEANGYVATIEAAINNGQVDVLLAKNDTSIAIEICNTTDPDWEVHNIKKCIDAGFDMVVSVSGDAKQLDRIKKKCIAAIDNFNTLPIQFFTPDVLFEYLAQMQVQQDMQPQPTTMKGYRVNVQYDATTQEEMKRKRSSVAQVVMNSLNKRKKQ